MNSKEYQKEILLGLLKKHQIRSARQIVTGRRIIIKPGELYKDYGKNNADIREKESIHQAAALLLERRFVTVDHLKFSEDIEKIYLREEKLDEIYEYLRESYGILPQSAIMTRIREILGKYQKAGELPRKYCAMVLEQAENPRYQPDPERVENNLKMLVFLENNRKKVYVKEASLLVYGDSKWFENHNYEEICTFLRTAAGRERQETERNDAILGCFSVEPAQQEIVIKGNWKIRWEQYELDISGLPGGIALTTGDARKITGISVDARSVMTVENKTSYQRMGNRDTAFLYLGGFAGREQIQFLKKVIFHNPHVRYQHFGDIDVGGFLIHAHLCRETGREFEMYKMGMEQLTDPRFRSCLRPLTENDLIRMESLLEQPAYKAVIRYMKEHQVKLEQEIISYYEGGQTP